MEMTFCDSTKEMMEEYLSMSRNAYAKEPSLHQHGGHDIFYF